MLKYESVFTKVSISSSWKINVLRHPSKTAKNSEATAGIFLIIRKITNKGVNKINGFMLNVLSSVFCILLRSSNELFS